MRVGLLALQQGMVSGQVGQKGRNTSIGGLARACQRAGSHGPFADPGIRSASGSQVSGGPFGASGTREAITWQNGRWL